MEWFQSLDLGREAVYALMSVTVGGILGWIGRALSAKKQTEYIMEQLLKEHRARLQEDREEYRAELRQISEQVAGLKNGGQLALEIMESSRRRHEELRKDWYEQQRARARAIGVQYYRSRHPWWKRAWARLRRCCAKATSSR